MKRGWCRLMLGLSLGGLPAVGDIPEDSSYRVILERNPFGLKDPPAEKPVDPSTTNVVVKVDIKLTGISSDGVTTRAWLVIPASGPVRPGQPAPQPKYLSLREGDEHESLKVLEINRRASTVKVLNAGQTVALNFKDHALPLTAVPPPAPGAQVPGGVVPRPGQPMPVPGKPMTPVPTPGISPVGGIPTAASGLIQQPQQQEVQAATGLKPIPARNVRTSSAGSSATVPTDPATQYLQMKAAEELARRYGVQYPPPPPPGPWNAAE